MAIIISIILAIVFAVVMIVLSVRANTRFRKEQKLPMQWMISRSQPLSSTVIRSAPRVIALGFVPFLGITVLSLFAIGATTLTPRPGQEGMLLPSLIFIGSRSEEHTSELQSLMRISYAVFCLKKKKKHNH